MPANGKISSILRSAELVFELGIINPTRFGPTIHANIPDYAEICMRVYLEEHKITPSFKCSFFELSNIIKQQGKDIDQREFGRVASYFLEIRDRFRNLLHHTHQAQGYVIERNEALFCLLMFDDFLKVIFPGMKHDDLGDLNYPCYYRYLKMEYEESRGVEILECIKR